ncbi:MAG: serine/threonine protein kinase [Spirochaetales bacterium]|nr:serine/threonine protein kinase [Spirochaetales bacterium]
MSDDQNIIEPDKTANIADMQTERIGSSANVSNKQDSDIPQKRSFDADRQNAARINGGKPIANKSAAKTTAVAGGQHPSDKANVGPRPQRRGNTEIKGYTILGKIAKGGMGEVYKGIHNGLGKEVILKKLIAKAPQTFYERFKREATIMMEVSHPNVVHLFDYFQENNSSYIVMEYVSGYNLSEIIKKFGQVPVYLACYIAYEIAKGLECAHEKGIIHRDIKPANVLISTKGEIKLTDFGIAFKTNREDEVNITKTGTLLGTPAYMSPEQINSSKDVDERTDLYALGIIFYEMLAGEKPFSNEFSVENLANIRKGKCKPLRYYNSDVPPYLVRIIKKLCNPKRTKRYYNIKEFIRKIESILFFKFKDVHEIRQKFSVLIGTQYSAAELDCFVYPKAAVMTEVISKVTLPILSGILIILFLWMALPQVLLTFAFSNQYGIMDLRVGSESAINYYDMQIYSPERGKNMVRRTGTVHRNKMRLHNIVLPTGSYVCQFRSGGKLTSTEFALRSYRTSRSNNVEITLRPDAKSNFTIVPTIIADRQINIADVDILYKRSSETDWLPYMTSTRLTNGETYDWIARCYGYKDAVIPAVSVPVGQRVLPLTFTLLKPKARLVLTESDIPLEISLGESNRVWLDEDGLKTGYVSRLGRLKSVYLNEGPITVTVTNKKFKVQASASATLDNRKEWVLRTEYDEKNNRLKVSVK